MCKDKDSLEQALRVAKSPHPEDFWKDGKLIKFFKIFFFKLTRSTFSQMTFQDGFIRDSLQANTHPLNRQGWVCVSLGRNGAVRATGPLPAQPDLSWLTWPEPARGQRKNLQPTHSRQEKEVKKKKKKDSSCYLALWIPLSTAMWSSSGFPSLQRAPEGQVAPREKEEKDMYVHCE